MKVKTETLSGPALAWAVAKVVGKKPRVFDGRKYGGSIKIKVKDEEEYWAPHERWDQGGPLMEAWQVDIAFCKAAILASLQLPNKLLYVIQPGPTILTAAMRCIVAKGAGDEVNIPKALAEA
jgi:hypothetical protein